MYSIGQKKYIELERTIAKAEAFLSKAAAIPVVGTLAGAAKMILGVIQTIGALLALIGSLPFLGTQNGKDVARRSVSHIINGLANIVSGALEAVPVLGALIYLGRIA